MRKLRAGWDEKIKGQILREKTDSNQSSSYVELDE